MVLMGVLSLLVAACATATPTSTTVPFATSTSQPTDAAQPTAAPTSIPTEEAEPPNFRFLISDDRNAIDDFASLLITITEIGLNLGGESGEWIEVEPTQQVVDLVPLQEENALEVWSGTVPEGSYTKVFIYVEKVVGFLVDAPDEELEIKLPSGKLQISKPFVVAAGEETTFIYDVTVTAAGPPGNPVKYLLKPQVGKSGADQPFKLVEPSDLTETPEATETPEPEESPEATETPAATETVEAEESPEATATVSPTVTP